MIQKEEEKASGKTSGVKFLDKMWRWKMRSFRDNELEMIQRLDGSRIKDRKIERIHERMKQILKHSKFQNQNCSFKPFQISKSALLF